MKENSPPLDWSSSNAKLIVMDMLDCYWQKGSDKILNLPVAQTNVIPSELPVKLSLVELPEWAYDCGVKGKILVPSFWFNKWEQVPWFDVIYWMAHGFAERVWENQNGCINSYSIKLIGWDQRLWDYAWVNRIGIFLRRWAAHTLDADEAVLFGSLPKAELVLTHDVDAIYKTIVIRVKQSLFNLFNAVRALVKGQPIEALRKCLAVLRFLFSADNYMCIPHLMEIEKKYGVRSTFHFYAGETGWKRSLRALLIDPSYDVTNKTLQSVYVNLLQGGWHIGLHPSVLSWDHPKGIDQQRKNLEEVIGKPVKSIRQHWLRFSWGKTWNAQLQAGLILDTTLGFNDRSGFRNSAALRMIVASDKNYPKKLESIPMVLMDSHLYDYNMLSSKDRLASMKCLLDELYIVGGVGSIIWHTQACGKDYGWLSGYEDLLAYWAELNSQS